MVFITEIRLVDFVQRKEEKLTGEHHFLPAESELLIQPLFWLSQLNRTWEREGRVHGGDKDLQN